MIEFSVHVLVMAGQEIGAGGYAAARSVKKYKASIERVKRVRKGRQTIFGAVQKYQLVGLIGLTKILLLLL